MSAVTSAGAGVGFRSERGPILIALMMSTALVALDSTIIATAVPSIVKGVGGFDQFPWLFSIYLLAQAVTVPIYGRLADLFGRRPLILWGIGLFLVGSVACGLAWSMPALIAFRLVQGLGAGAIQPMSITIVGDLYTLEERARVQGYIASVWGVASVVGPTLGGVFAEYVSWRWIFYVNVPLCILAAGMLLRCFHETVDRSRRPQIDYPGAGLLTTGCALLILGVLEGGVSWAWLSVPSFVVLGVGALSLGSFVAVERRVAAPVLPLWVFTRRLLISTSLVSAGVGATVLGLSTYIPTYLQDVLGSGPLVAGLALAALTLGWPLAASRSGRLYLRVGFRRCALIGCGPVVVGTALLITLGTRSTIWEVAAMCFLVGVGMGLAATPTLIAAQSTVAWNERGVVTGNNMFCRSIGSALGVAVFGAIANAVLGSASHPNHTRTAVSTASHHVFIAVALVAVGIALAVLSMPVDNARTRALAAQAARAVQGAESAA